MRLRSWLAVASLALAAPARAELWSPEPLYPSTYYEISPIVMQGGLSWQGDDLRAAGIHIYERNGLAGKLLATFLVAAAGGVAQGMSGDKVITGSSSRQYQSGDYLVTETTTNYRYKTAEEKAREKQAVEDSIDAAAMNNYHMDLVIFRPQGDRTVSGFTWALYPFSYGARWTIDLGFSWTRLRDDKGPTGAGPDPAGVPLDGRRRHNSFGMPLRLGYMPWNRFGVEVEYVWNWFYDVGDDPMSPEQENKQSIVRGTVTISPIDRVFARAGANLPVWDRDAIGYTLEAGVRF